ncbi:Protein spire-like protein 2 [Camelus dromedarius]|uniref:Protein spire-like protein 2 n=1 Tax=Camelus dromedarius TaxID=9838 RepID=A0A5N4CWG7_CAMDR|nr:Protein spire-like protein 2 [Camelus dromedarius]
MEEMNTSEEEESPCREVTLKQDSSFSQHDLGPALERSDLWPVAGHWVLRRVDTTVAQHGDLGSAEDRLGASAAPDANHLWLEFSHQVESLVLTLEVMDVRHVLVKADLERFLQNKELLSGLKKGRFAATMEPSSRCPHGCPISFARQLSALPAT